MVGILSPWSIRVVDVVLACSHIPLSFTYAQVRLEPVNRFRELVDRLFQLRMSRFCRSARGFEGKEPQFHARRRYRSAPCDAPYHGKGAEDGGDHRDDGGDFTCTHSAAS